MLSNLLLAFFPILFILLSNANASSPRPRPLKRLEHPSSLSLKILPRVPPLQTRLAARDSAPIALDTDPHIKHSDSIRISITAFSDIFYLHLSPNNDLLHPDAHIKYYKAAPDGHGSVLDRVEPINRESILIFGGKVFHDHHTQAALREEYAGGVWRPNGVRAPGERGWARIMVHDGGDPTNGLPPVFEGSFSVDGVIHHVSTKHQYLTTKLPLDPDPHPLDDTNLVIFRDSDIASIEEEEHLTTGKPLSETRKTRPPTTCSHDRLAYNVFKSNPVLRWGAGFDRSPQETWIDSFGLNDHHRRQNGSLLPRQGDINNAGDGMTSNFVDSIGSTDGCPIAQQIIYMGVVADCEYTKQYGGGRNATQQILVNWNNVSLLYKSTFNVSLGIIEMQIQEANCPASDTANPWNVACGTVSLNERLSLFSAWRGQKFDSLNGGNDPSGLWHLMSGCPSGTEVGVAWLGTVCNQKATGNAPSVVSGTAVSTGGRTEWQVVAHEIGHNFGGIHDCADGCTLSDDCCPSSAQTCNSNSRFLMSPVSSSSEQVFSPCTIGNICSLMKGRNIDMTCIRPPNPEQQTFSLQMCGNGIIEAGEECDPGAGSTSPCCDTATCKLRSGAVCDPLSSPCCSQTCQFAPATQVCRASKDSTCDIVETCTGTSASCPADQTTPNGQSCGANGLACANGLCTSVAEQCKTVGASLGLKEACPQSQQNCQISCQDPKNPQQCVVLNSQLVIGSPCGFGGTCDDKGSCQSGTLLQTAVSWYRQNLQIAIPVSVVVGIIALLLFISLMRCLKRCCCGRSKPKAAPNTGLTVAIPPGVPGQRIPSWPTLPTTGNNGGGNSGRDRPDSTLPLIQQSPQRAISPTPNERLSDSSAYAPFATIPGPGSGPGPAGRMSPQFPSSLRPGGRSYSPSVSTPPPVPAPSYPLPPAAPRQSTWGGRPLIQTQRVASDQDRSRWVDEQMYNGPRS